MSSLTADVGIFGFTGEPVGARLTAMTGFFALTGEPATFSRQYSVDIGNLKLRLERLASAFPVVDNMGRPTGQFQRFWQKHCEAIEQAYASLASAVIAIQTAYDAASQASAAASDAADAATQATDAAITTTNLVDDLQGGVLNFPIIKIGGATFYNNAGSLETA